MSTTVQDLPLAKIAVAEGHNPREDFAADALKDLTASVKANGVLSPILVAPAKDGSYVLIAGERRLRAAKAAKLPTIPAVVRAAANGDSDSLALIENLVRVDLNPVEEAKGYERLLGNKHTVKQIAKVLTVPEQRVKDRLAILALPEQTQGYVAAGTVPLAAVPALTVIAAASPATCEAVSFMVAEGLARPSELVEEPHRVIGQAERMLWHDGAGQQTEPVDCPDCDGTGDLTDYDADEDGDYQECPKCKGAGTIDPPEAEGRRLPIVSTRAVNSLAAFEHMIDAEAYAALVAKLDEAIPQPANDYDYNGQRFRRIEFTTDDEDAARAYGCLLEFKSGYSRAAWITDGEWLADRLGQIVGRQIDAYGKSTRATKQHAAAAGGDDEKKAAREERRKEREKAAREQAKARSMNEKLGADLITKRGSVKLTRDVALTLSHMILGGRQWGEISTAQALAVSGLRYVHPDLARTREVRGQPSPDLAPADEATAFLFDWIGRAKTAEEVLGRTLSAVLAGVYADEDAAPTKKARLEKGASYSLPSVRIGYGTPQSQVPGHKQLDEQLPKLIEKLAKGVVPDALIAKSKKRY